jgi:RNA polymerase primary sigma factor
VVGSLIDTLFEGDVRTETGGVLGTLTPHEETVIRLRFGIGCDREHTLEEIARRLDLSREQARKIEGQAFSATSTPRRFDPAASSDGRPVRIV